MSAPTSICERICATGGLMTPREGVWAADASPALDGREIRSRNGTVVKGLAFDAHAAKYDLTDGMG